MRRGAKVWQGGPAPAAPSVWSVYSVVPRSATEPRGIPLSLFRLSHPGGGVTPARSEGGDRYHVPRTQNPSRTPPWQPCRPRRSLCSVCLRVHPWIKAPTCASVIRGLVPRTHVSGSTGIWTASRSTAGGPVTLSLRKLPATSEAGPRFAGDHGRHGRRPALIGAGCDQGKVGGTHACGGVRLFRSTVSSMRGPAPGIPQNS